MKKIYIIGTIVIVFLIIAVSIYFSIRERYAYEEFAYSTPLRENTDDSSGVNFGKQDGKAYVISNVKTSKKVAALTFDNVPSIEVANEIMDILDEKGYKGTFFVQGSRIYEEPDLPKIITERGHFVGNATLTGAKDFDKLSIDDMIKEFSTTSELIEKSSGYLPIYFRINGIYSENVLYSANASSLIAGVPYTVRIDANTIKDKDKAERFVKYLKIGSVIDVDTSKTENLSNMLKLLTESSKDAGLNYISIKELEKLHNPNVNANSVDEDTSSSKDVLRRINVADNLATLTFDGVGDEKFITDILAELDKANVKALFFVSGEEVEAKTDIIKKIISKGHEVGSNLMSGRNIDTFDFDETYSEVTEANQVFLEKLGFTPKYIRPKNGKTNKFISQVAKHTKQIFMTYSNNPLDKNMISANEISSLVVSKIKKGDIIILNADTNREVINAIPLISSGLDKKGFKLVSFNTLYNSPRYVASISKIEKDEKKAEKQAQSNGKPANNADVEVEVEEPNVDYDKEVFSYAHTTAKKVALTFDGIGDGSLINGILDELDKAKIKATFFVPNSEISKNAEIIKTIKAKGHEIGLNTTSKAGAEDASYSTAYKDISGGINSFKELGIDFKYIRPAFGKYGDMLLKASSVLDKKVVTYSKNPLDKRMISADQIMEYIQKKITRGEIILLNADTNPAVIQSIPRIVDFVRDIGYDFTTIDDLYNGQYQVKSFEEIENHDKIKINYHFPDTPPKFVTQIPNNENKVFITFDDWGGDKVITSILDTLEQKGVKASFFLRAAGVENNMNLAKAISDAGHDVASHTYSHTDIIEMSKEDLENDLYKAHKIITEAIQRCPELFMRPPRLYEDVESLRTVKAMGYHAIMSSDVSSHDWEEGLSAESIKNDILTRTKSGTVIIMHLLDDAKGHEILGDLIDKLRAKGFTFGKISEYIK